MMNERRRKRQILKVDHYDGQCIFIGQELYYELGGYLGGGAAGVVYEAFCARTKRHVAIKILNPVGYKLLPSALLSRCIVAVQGKPLAPSNVGSHDDDDDRDVPYSRAQAAYNVRHAGGNLTPGGSNRFSSVSTRMQLENVWWLVHPSTKQAVAAYEDPRTGMLRELSLPQCLDVWGCELQVDDFHDDVDRKFALLEAAVQDVFVKNQQLTIPKIPKKFIKFAHTRRTIHREICNMSGLGFHENVLRLHEALELVQDSKCTTFLVLELAAGGELFDRIKLDCGTDEGTARRYFQQLISGVAFCHASGVCHRDLKPENLLLADTEELSTLKIADFGLSAIFAMAEQGSEASLGQSSSHATAATVQAIRRLRSVVGSPHYVAPEVLMDAGQGYDGAKADAWSIGVIVYAMLAGNLPFGKDLLKCLRYEKFKKWCYNTKYSDEDPVDEDAFPSWFFPAPFSLEVKSLITQLLYPDPSMRLSVDEAQRHAWVLGEQLTRRADYSIHADDPEASSLSTTPLLNAPAPGNAPLSSSANFRDGPNAVANAPQSLMDQERWSQRGTAASPSGFHRMPLHGRSPTASGVMASSLTSTSPLGVPPSPQKAALRAHLMSSGYMPSLDETAPLSSGQTPVSSPRHSDLQFEMDHSPTCMNDETESLTSATIVADKSEILREEISRDCHRTASLVGAETACSTQLSPAIDRETRSSRQRFTSPPLASSSLLAHTQYLHRRNSPPELFLSRFGRGFKFEAIRTAFEEIDLDPFHASVNLATTPTDSAALRAHHQSMDSHSADPARRIRSRSSSQSVPNTPMALTQPSAATDHTTSSSTGPPSFQAELVARSTRFITTLPAQLVLTKIQAIVQANPSPVPPSATPTTHNQRVVIDWDDYQMEVRYGDVLTCTVQVFLFQRGVYLVEFRRGQVEIFQFKRFYEDLREQLADGTDLPRHHASPRRLSSAHADALDDQDEDCDHEPPRTFPRKRNKSIGVHAELLR